MEQCQHFADLAWYTKMLGAEGMTDATRYAILNANYIKSRLEPYFRCCIRGRMVVSRMK